MSRRQLPPDRVSFYFRAESGVLAVITVTGLLYNIGLVAGPWFEGQMTEALARILLGEGSFSVMVSLAAGYIAVIAAVQGLRFLKRFYVRRFANKVNRRMKRVLYGALVRSDRATKISASPTSTGPSSSLAAWCWWSLRWPTSRSRSVTGSGKPLFLI